jgi:hypothetical protein
MRGANLYRAQWHALITDGPLLFLCSDASAYVTGQTPGWLTGDIPQMKALVYDSFKHWFTAIC